MPYSSGAAGTSYPYWYYPYGMEQWLEENRPASITKGQWNSHGETLKETHDAAHTNGKRIDETKASLSGGIKGTYDAVKDTHSTVKGVQDSLKETYDEIKKNHNEYITKQDGCAAEIGKVRQYLEDEAKQREESYQRQRDAWYYSQYMRQARDAEAGSTRSQSSSKSSRSGRSSSSDKPRKHRDRYEDSYEAERRHRDRELKQDFLDNLREVLRETHQTPPPPWVEHPFPPFPGNPDFFYHGGHAGGSGGFGQPQPPRQPHNPFMPYGSRGRGPRH